MSSFLLHSVNPPREITGTGLIKSRLPLFSISIAISKWFLGALGHDGLNKMVQPYDDHSATAVCTFAFCSGPDSEPILFQGRTEVRSLDEKVAGKL